MLRSFHSHSRGVLVLLAVTAFVLGGCGGNSGTSAPSSTPTSAASSQASATEQSTDSGTIIPDGDKAFSAVTSFQFTMTVEGGTLGDTLSLLPAASTDNATFQLKGTYVLRPDKAADVTVTNSIHVISIGGFDYVDSDGTGYTKNDATSSSYADSLSPVAFFGALDFSKGFESKGSETKNGVDAEHFVANDAGVAALKQMGSVTSVPDAQWIGEIWIAKTGGYPVRMSITATATGTTTVVFQRVFDITHIDDPSNKVTAPANVTGA